MDKIGTNRSLLDTWEENAVEIVSSSYFQISFIYFRTNTFLALNQDDTIKMNGRWIMIENVTYLHRRNCQRWFLRTKCINFAEKFPSHTVAMPLDVAALIVIGSIISLGLTTLAVLAILHIKSKLFETIRLSICDADKRDICNDTIQKAALEKGNSGRISSTGSSNAILACEYGKCTRNSHNCTRRNAFLMATLHNKAQVRIYIISLK